MSVRCPHCATTVSANKARRQGNVYTYNGVTIRGTPDEQSGQVSKAEYALTAYFFVESAKYFIAECVECRNEFVVQRNPERVCWPLPNPAIPTEIPEAVRLAFQDAKVAHEAGAEIAAVMAARTAIIRMQRDQKCSSLKELVERGTLSRFLAYQADEVRLWGNFVGHEDEGADSPSREDTDQLLQYLGLVLDHVYVEPVRLIALRDKRKPE